MAWDACCSFGGGWLGEGQTYLVTTNFRESSKHTGAGHPPRDGVLTLNHGLVATALLSKGHHLSLSRYLPVWPSHMVYTGLSRAILCPSMVT